MCIDAGWHGRFSLLVQRCEKLSPVRAVENAMFQHGHEERVVTNELGHPIAKRSAELVAYPVFRFTYHGGWVVAKLCVFSFETLVEHELLMKFTFAILQRSVKLSGR